MLLESGPFDNNGDFQAGSFGPAAPKSQVGKVLPDGKAITFPVLFALRREIYPQLNSSRDHVRAPPLLQRGRS